MVFTDYGFIKQPSGIDLINHRRKIAIELKNGYRINSIVKREDLRRLREFKAQHPRYTVILGFINGKRPEGKSRFKNNVHIMTGKRFLRYIFRGHEENIIQSLRRAVQSVVHLSYNLSPLNISTGNSTDFQTCIRLSYSLLFKCLSKFSC